MRIAVFTDSFLPYICGATFAALNQVNALARRGHAVRIYCPGSTHDRPHTSETDELHESVSVQTVPFSLPWGGQPDLNVVFPVLWPTMRDLRKFKPDAIHVHTEWGTGWAGVFAAWRLKIPVVGTFHTFWDDPRYVHHFPSNGMPTPAPAVADQVRALRQEYGLTDEPTFLYLGRVSFEKSLPVCLLAFKELLSTHPQARFVMIGDGPEMPALKGMIHAMDMEAQVMLTGAVAHEELMARGLPRLGDVFITASETELMRRLVDSPEQRSKLAAGALATAALHSIDRTGERLRILYEACIEDPATARAALENPDPAADAALSQSS